MADSIVLCSDKCLINACGIELTEPKDMFLLIDLTVSQLLVWIQKCIMVPASQGIDKISS